jgi:hypothetical protein
MTVRRDNSPDHLPAGPFQFTIEQWDAAKGEVVGILRERATRGTPTVAYGELAAQVQAVRLGPDDIRFHALLGEVCIDEHRAGRPLLSLLVVRQDDMLPGKGFFTLARQLKFNVSNELKFWSDELRRVTDYWSGKAGGAEVHP